MCCLLFFVFFLLPTTAPDISYQLTSPSLPAVSRPRVVTARSDSAGGGQGPLRLVRAPLFARESGGGGGGGCTVYSDVLPGLGNEAIIDMSGFWGGGGEFSLLPPSPLFSLLFSFMFPRPRMPPRRTCLRVRRLLCCVPLPFERITASGVFFWWEEDMVSPFLFSSHPWPAFAPSRPPFLVNRFDLIWWVAFLRGEAAGDFFPALSCISGFWQFVCSFFFLFFQFLDLVRMGRKAGRGGLRLRYCGFLSPPPSHPPS